MSLSFSFAQNISFLLSFYNHSFIYYCTYSYKFVENCKPLILQSNLNYPIIINVYNKVSYNLLYNKITM